MGLCDLQKIGRVTFAETFSLGNSPEAMAKYLAQKFSIGKLGEDLQNPDSESYFAEGNGKVAGYLEVTAGGITEKWEARKVGKFRLKK